MNYIELAGAVLGSGAISALIAGMLARRKSNAEAKQVEVSTQIDVAKAAMEYADRIEKMFINRLNDLTQEIIMLKAENIALRQKIEQLITENNQLRIEIGKLSHPND